MRKKKVGLRMICLGLFILSCVVLGIYNLMKNPDFFKAPLTTIATMFVAVVVSYFFVQRRTDYRRKSEKVDQMLYKIQDEILDKDFLTIKEWDLIKHRSIANKIKYLKEHVDDQFKADVARIEENFEAFRTFYGNHYSDADYMEKSKKELMNYVTLIDDACDKIHMKLL